MASVVAVRCRRAVRRRRTIRTVRVARLRDGRVVRRRIGRHGPRVPSEERDEDRNDNDQRDADRRAAASAIFPDDYRIAHVSVVLPSSHRSALDAQTGRASRVFPLARKHKPLHSRNGQA